MCCQTTAQTTGVSFVKKRNSKAVQTIADWCLTCQLVRGYVRGDTVTVWRDRRAGETDADKRGPEQVLTVNNERFSVAELLFNPSDIGIQQGGLAEATAQAIQAMPVDMQGPAYHNIVSTAQMLFTFSLRCVEVYLPYESSIHTCSFMDLGADWRQCKVAWI
eukprot:SAG31_NODE_81_length_27131_cov_4.775283_12_plen_162_part_00